MGYCFKELITSKISIDAVCKRLISPLSIAKYEQRKGDHFELQGEVAVVRWRVRLLLRRVPL
jgi:hypothetical protein